MAKNRTTVEINGRLYDASTGEIVDSIQPVQVIDGFRMQAASPVHPSTPSRTVNQATRLHAKPQRTQKLHPAIAGKPQPVRTINNVIAPKAVPITTIQPAAQAALDRSVQLERAKRAQQYSQSHHVSKFATTTDAAPQPVPTVAQPRPMAAMPAAPASPVMPRPVVQQQRSPQANRPSQVVEQTAEAPTEAASNDQKVSWYKRRVKLVPTTFVFMLLFGVGGYYVYSNIPHFALRIASSRAGVQASLPGYKPSGYEFAGPVSYADGVIEMGFKSNSDDRSYNIAVKESAWDSQSLLDNFIEPMTNDYAIFQQGGLTVYVYNQSNATWVDGGTWYTITGNQLMTSEQLLKIADSL